VFFICGSALNIFPLFITAMDGNYSICWDRIPTRLHASIAWSTEHEYDNYSIYTMNTMKDNFVNFDGSLSNCAMSRAAGAGLLMQSGNTDAE
jgi:hypothetical protein